MWEQNIKEVIFMTEEQVLKRDCYFDNLKGVLIFIVVLGHFLSKMNNLDNSIVRTLYSYIFLFHMPLFILVSGYFSKKFKFIRVMDLLIVYMIFQFFIYPIGMALISGKIIDFTWQSLVIPRYTYWYLLSLVVWKCITPILPKNYIVLFILLLISVIPSITPGIDWRILSIGRTISFYPFFYFGYLIDKSKFTKIFLNVPKKICFIGIIVINIICYIVFTEKGITTKILHYKNHLINYIPDIKYIIIIKLLILLLSILAMVFICSIIDKENETILTKWGQNTLIIYLVHGMIVKSMSIGLESISQLSFILLSLVASYGICELLSTQWSKKYIGMLTNISIYKYVKIQQINFKIKYINS